MSEQLAFVFTIIYTYCSEVNFESVSYLWAVYKVYWTPLSALIKINSYGFKNQTTAVNIYEYFNVLINLFGGELNAPTSV